MDGEGGAVHGLAAVRHVPVLVHADQDGDADAAQTPAERVRPEPAGELRVAGRDVPRQPLVETQAREQPGGGGERPLAVLAPLGRRARGRAVARRGAAL